MNRYDLFGVFKMIVVFLVFVDYIFELEGVMMGELVEVIDFVKSIVYVYFKMFVEYGYVVNVDNEYYFGVKFCYFGDYVRMCKDYYCVV